VLRVARQRRSETASQGAHRRDLQQLGAVVVEAWVVRRETGREEEVACSCQDWSGDHSQAALGLVL